MWMIKFDANDLPQKGALNWLPLAVNVEGILFSSNYVPDAKCMNYVPKLFFIKFTALIGTYYEEIMRES